MLTHAEDATAMAYNPANLVLVEDPSLVVAATFARMRTKYTSLYGGTTERSSSDIQVLPNLFFAHRMDDRSVLGLALTTPHGQSMEWPRQGAFRYTAPYYAEMRLVNINPTVAYALTDTLSLGIGADFFVSDLDLRQVYPWNPAMPGTADGRARLEGDGTGFGGNIGLGWDVTAQQRVALTYRTSVSVDYEGSARISGMPPPVAAALGRSSDFSTEIPFPETFAAGYGVQLSGPVRLEVYLERLHWSSHDRQTLDLGRYAPLLGDAATIRHDWRDTWTAGMGADWAISEAQILRAGYTFIESPVRERTFSPVLPDGDRHVLSLGWGIALGRHTLDVACAYSYIKDQEIRGNQMPAYDGDYEMTPLLAAVQYGYMF